MINILKNTKSICPNCLIEIDAKIIEKNNKVYMIKECPRHGKFIVLVEKDVEFYKKSMNQHSVKRKKPFQNLMIPFTHKCNLNCNYCWLPQRDREDLLIEDMQKIVSKSDCDQVRISGGEPTLREDLLYIIRFIRKNKKRSSLLTNGLKLANLSYVKRLKDAGLDNICFSFNGFKDSIYEKINGKKLLKVKLKALANIKKVGIDTTLSVMLVKGVNERELKKIFDYCLKNISFIKELRIRSMAPMGRYAKSSGFFVSELIDMFSKILNIDRKEFIKSINEKDHVPCFFTGWLCSYKDENHIHPWVLIGKGLWDGKPIIDKIPVAFKLVNKFKIKILSRFIINRIRKKNILFLKLELRSWPNNYNIDLGEMEKCHTSQLSKNGVFPFCYSLILNNENIIEL